MINEYQLQKLNDYQKAFSLIKLIKTISLYKVLDKEIVLTLCEKCTIFNDNEKILLKEKINSLLHERFTVIQKEENFMFKFLQIFEEKYKKVKELCFNNQELIVGELYNFESYVFRNKTFSEKETRLLKVKNIGQIYPSFSSITLSNENCIFLGEVFHETLKVKHKYFLTEKDIIQIPANVHTHAHWFLKDNIITIFSEEL